MTEQRVNAAGETVEFNKDSQRWEPVSKDSEAAPKLEDTKEFSAVPADDDADESLNAFDDTPEEDK